MLVRLDAGVGESVGLPWHGGDRTQVGNPSAFWVKPWQADHGIRYSDHWLRREVCVAVHPGTDGSNHQRSSTRHESVATWRVFQRSAGTSSLQIIRSCVPFLARIAIFWTRPSICWMRLAHASSWGPGWGLRKKKHHWTLQPVTQTSSVICSEVTKSSLLGRASILTVVTGGRVCQLRWAIQFVELLVLFRQMTLSCSMEIANVSWFRGPLDATETKLK